MEAVQLAVTAIIGIVMGFVVYIATAQLNPVLADLLETEEEWMGQELISEAGVLLINVGAFIIGFSLPFLALAVVTGKLSN